jgi:ribosomal protein S18 acetylase RimI-like enzyme
MNVSLRPATDADVAEYLADAREHYLAELLEAGVAPMAAAKNADESFARAFPDGRPADRNLVFRVEREGEKAGILWIGPRAAEEPDRWWVWDIVIAEAYRGQGIGRQTMLLAESEARARGASELGLNVFGHNTVAVGLYRSLDYETTAIQMRKRL